MEFLEFPALLYGRAARETDSTIMLTPSVSLYKTDIDIQSDTPLSTFTANECNYSGYAAQAIVWLPPTIAADGTYEVVSTPLIFNPNNTTVSNNVFGCFITENGGANLYFAGRLDGAPIPMSDLTSQIILVIRYRPADQSLTVDII